MMARNSPVARDDRVGVLGRAMNSSRTPALTISAPMGSRASRSIE
jgi:hypothetical protein